MTENLRLQVSKKREYEELQSTDVYPIHPTNYAAYRRIRPLVDFILLKM
jgi:hypothetical protein